MGSNAWIPFIHGWLLAFGLILPLGPQNTYLFMQGMRQPSVLYALPAVLASFLSDTLLTLSGIYGLSQLIGTVPNALTFIKIAGILFLIWVGWSFWKSSLPITHASIDHMQQTSPSLAGIHSSAEQKTPSQSFTSSLKNEARGDPPLRQIIFAFSISLFNPHAIMDTIGVIGTSAQLYDGDGKTFFAAGALLTSFSFFFTLVVVGHTMRRLGATFMTTIGKISALLMWISALWMIFNL
ncbi:MAG: LysE family transporter [Candidatus Carbobacillus sp.]|nr:LysE family transporter [Candidatus Carbobacillus sp.]